MDRRTWCILVIALTTLLVLPGPGGTVQADETRNPFGVKDVPDPDGKDVRDFAAKVKLAGDDKDANAKQWVKDATPGKKGSLDGRWSERWNDAGGEWNVGKEGTRIKVVGDRVYFLVHASNGKFLVDTKREKNRLVGRFQGIDDPRDVGPAVFVIVDDERLDGEWAGKGKGRWDFRRKMKKE